MDVNLTLEAEELPSRPRKEKPNRAKRAEPNPEELRTLLDELSAIFSRFLRLEPGAADILALWVFVTHTMDWHRHNPSLLLWSSQYGSGKSTALEMLSYLLRKVRHVSNSTEAAIFRRLDDGYGLLLDETDAWRPEVRNAVKSILNGAHSRGGSYVERADLDDQKKVKAYSTWCPLAFASKARELSDGQVRRSIKITMKKALPHELKERWDALVHPQLLEGLRIRIQGWREEARVDPSKTFPDMPADVQHPDTWRPLFVIAGLAGGDWPQRVREAARSAPKQEDDEGVRLLRDIKNVFDAVEDDRLYTETILEKLHKREWGEMPRTGRALTGHALGRLLKPYGIAPLDEAFGKGRQRGYERAAFEETWARHGL